MYLWIDDVRPPPDDSWHWAKTSKEALDVLGCGVQVISFDHDLGGDDTTMPVAIEIERRAFAGRPIPDVWHIHSANPVGRKNLEAALRKADWFRAQNAEEAGL